jgi:hypothetical protein
MYDECVPLLTGCCLLGYGLILVVNSDGLTIAHKWYRPQMRS